MNHGHTRIHKTHHGLNLGEVTTFPLIVFSTAHHENYTQMTFFSGFLTIPEIGTPVTLGIYKFLCKPLIEVKTKAKLYLSSRAFQCHVAHLLHPCNLGQFLIFSGWESKLILWLPTILLTITCAISIQMDNASPF
jgi:hypothetical protein